MNGEPLNYTLAVTRYTRILPHLRPRTRNTDGRKSNSRSPRGQERDAGDHNQLVHAFAHLTPCFGPHGSMRHVCAFTAKKSNNARALIYRAVFFVAYTYMFLTNVLKNCMGYYYCNFSKTRY